MTYPERPDDDFYAVREDVRGGTCEQLQGATCSQP